MRSKLRRDQETALLRFVRFRRVLESARAVLELQRDGREKLTGDYVFDRQYVVSLVEQVLERVGTLLHDAAVLAPEVGERLVEDMDGCRVGAQSVLAGGGSVPDELRDPAATEDSAEYRLLASALRWIDHPTEPEQRSVRSTMNRIIDTLAHQARSAPAVAEVTLGPSQGGAILHVLPFEASTLASDVSPTIAEIRCTPLGILASALDSGGNDTCPRSRWHAVLGTDRLSLRSLDGAGALLLEATCSGYAPDDFVFLYWSPPGTMEGSIPPGLHQERTPLGAMAWSREAPAHDLERHLETLGQILFGPTGSDSPAP